MKQGMIIAALTAVLGTTAACANEKCDVAEADWQPQEALEQKLAAEGWEVRRVKVDEGCYEVYGTDAEGRRMETYFNPQTFEVVSSEIED